MDTDNPLPIEVTTEDGKLLAEIAKAKYRNPDQQAASYVHDALEAVRAKANAPEKPTNGTRRGTRDKAAA